MKSTKPIEKEKLEESDESDEDQVADTLSFEIEETKEECENKLAEKRRLV